MPQWIGRPVMRAKKKRHEGACCMRAASRMSALGDGSRHVAHSAGALARATFKADWKDEGIEPQPAGFFHDKPTGKTKAKGQTHWPGLSAFHLEQVVGGTGFEPVTPTMSR